MQKSRERNTSSRRPQRGTAAARAPVAARRPRVTDPIREAASARRRRRSWRPAPPSVDPSAAPPLGLIRSLAGGDEEGAPLMYRQEPVLCTFTNWRHVLHAVRLPRESLAVRDTLSGPEPAGGRHQEDTVDHPVSWPFFEELDRRLVSAMVSKISGLISILRGLHYHPASGIMTQPLLDIVNGGYFADLTKGDIPLISDAEVATVYLAAARLYEQCHDGLFRDRAEHRGGAAAGHTVRVDERQLRGYPEFVPALHTGPAEGAGQGLGAMPWTCNNRVLFLLTEVKSVDFYLSLLSPPCAGADRLKLRTRTRAVLSNRTELHTPEGDRDRDLAAAAAVSSGAGSGSGSTFLGADSRCRNLTNSSPKDFLAAAAAASAAETPDTALGPPTTPPPLAEARSASLTPRQCAMTCRASSRLAGGACTQASTRLRISGFSTLPAFSARISSAAAAASSRAAAASASSFARSSSVGGGGESASGGHGLGRLGQLRPAGLQLARQTQPLGLGAGGAVARVHLLPSGVGAASRGFQLLQAGLQLLLSGLRRQQLRRVALLNFHQRLQLGGLGPQKFAPFGQLSQAALLLQALLQFTQALPQLPVLLISHRVILNQSLVLIAQLLLLLFSLRGQLGLALLQAQLLRLQFQNLLLPGGQQAALLRRCRRCRSCIVIQRLTSALQLVQSLNLCVFACKLFIQGVNLRALPAALPSTRRSASEAGQQSLILTDRRHFAIDATFQSPSLCLRAALSMSCLQLLHQLVHLVFNLGNCFSFRLSSRTLGLLCGLRVQLLGQLLNLQTQCGSLSLSGISLGNSLGQGLPERIQLSGQVGNFCIFGLISIRGLLNCSANDATSASARSSRSPSCLASSPDAASSARSCASSCAAAFSSAELLCTCWRSSRASALAASARSFMGLIPLGGQVGHVGQLALQLRALQPQLASLVLRTHQPGRLGRLLLQLALAILQ
uniref:Uncharacterized protein n=1 Tax=Macrostomum lignano TaxID=282301 RepID=A0A1I8IU07_9PLAT